MALGSSVASRHHRFGRTRTYIAPLLHAAPPRRDAFDVRRFHRFAEPRHHQLRAGLRSQRQQCFGWLIPRVHGQAERAPVHRQKCAAAQHRQRFQRIFGPEVNVAPCRMECAHFEHHEVERREPLAHHFKLVGEAAVAAEEHRVPLGADHHRRPQRRIAIFHAASGEVLRRRRRYRQPGIRQPVRLPPVEFDDAFRPNAPRFQMRADAKRRHERHVAFHEFSDGRIVEVVVVVMRHDHQIDRRQRSQRHRHRLEALRPGESRRRRARSPYRIR